LLLQCVAPLLEQPERLQAEYERRLRDGAEREQEDAVAGLQTQIRKLRQSRGRLIDSYADGLIDQEDFAPRMARLKERIATLEREARDAAAQAAQQRELRVVVGRLEDFAQTVRGNLDQVAWEAQRTIIRTLVKRVEVDLDEIRVIFRVGPDPPDGNGQAAILPDRSRCLEAKRGTSENLYERWRTRHNTSSVEPFKTVVGAHRCVPRWVRLLCTPARFSLDWTPFSGHRENFSQCLDHDAVSLPGRLMPKVMPKSFEIVCEAWYARRRYCACVRIERLACWTRIAQHFWGLTLYKTDLKL
jgi:hypothetical protein